ncbi:hypothetical protein DSO57_1020588 [Entomophthora muscae]|uniref:Uncharacterized protein n=1 Tax=Entomophthora muscae TaxID=34485 RepID=A0ACC2TF66_9FUNG|nr:hypothetical protein DSO57_1020588 [Entomophthora muscae]
MKASATFSLLIASVLASPLLVERRQDQMESHEEHDSSPEGNDNIISGFFGQIRGLVGSTAKTFSQITGLDLTNDSDSYDVESGGEHSHGSGGHGSSSGGGYGASEPEDEHGSGGPSSSIGGGHGASEPEDESISFGGDSSDFGSGRGYGSRSKGEFGAPDEPFGLSGDTTTHGSGGHGSSGHGADESAGTAGGHGHDASEDNLGSEKGSPGHGESHMSASPPRSAARKKDSYGKTNKRVAQVRSASANDDDLFNDDALGMETRSLDSGDDFGDSSSHKKGEESQPDGFFSRLGLGSVPILGQY